MAPCPPPLNPPLRVTGRLEALLDTATQERVKAIAIGCSTTAESCRQAVSYLREQCGLEHIVHGVRRPRPTYRWPDARTPCL